MPHTQWWLSAGPSPFVSVPPAVSLSLAVVRSSSSGWLPVLWPSLVAEPPAPQPLRAVWPKRTQTPGVKTLHIRRRKQNAAELLWPAYSASGSPLRWAGRPGTAPESRCAAGFLSSALLPSDTFSLGCWCVCLDCVSANVTDRYDNHLYTKEELLTTNV